MRDVLGYRAKFGVLAPSTNTIVAPDFYAMAPPGVTNHFSRIYIANQNMRDNTEAENLLLQIRASIEQAVREVKTCEPDYMVMGMSSETFWFGKQGNQDFIERIRNWTGLDCATGASATDLALRLFGAKRISLVSPYQPVFNERVKIYFEQCGYEVVAVDELKCPNAIAIAHVDEDTLRQAILRVNLPDVDAIVQVGTNLSMLQLADEAERWLKKPVIAINAAIYWQALRANGVKDKFRGFGTLLREY
ncbi:MAG: arylmalonate decarboxylase [Chloroflexi bacterium]|nr:arylmalonate decarboxylase [Chloroflexota bacterium]